MLINKASILVIREGAAQSSLVSSVIFQQFEIFDQKFGVNTLKNQLKESPILSNMGESSVVVSVGTSAESVQAANTKREKQNAIDIKILNFFIIFISSLFLHMI
jgi:hypothetical protein